MEREYSAIDAIYQILDKINDMDKKIQIIDDNIKILNNKVTKMNKVSAQEVQRPTAVAVDPINVNINTNDDIQTKEPEKLLLGTVKVYGYIINKMRQPVPDVVVNIFDNTNKLVKSNKSNNDGYWECRLPSGRFNIEYIHSKFKPINREAEIPKNVKEYEIK